MYGTWKSSFGDSYVISEKTMESYYGDALSFSWDIVEICPTENGGNTWYVYGKVTKAVDTDYGAPYDIGTYFAAYVEILQGGKGIKLSCAHKDTNNQDDNFDTVKSTFTDTNGYYSYKAEYASAE